MKNKLKVTFFLNKLQHYRIPIIEKLVKDTGWDITIVTPTESSDLPIIKSHLFKREFVEKNKAFGFSWFKQDILNYIKGADVCIYLFDLRDPSVFYFSSIAKYRSKSLLWGIGVSGSYRKKFGKIDFATLVRYWWAKRVKCIILYSEFAANAFQFLGLPQSRIIVAKNTVSNSRDITILKDIEAKKNLNIIFVGTLYPQKGLIELVESFIKFIKSNEKLPPEFTLTIIGEGILRERLEQLVIDSCLHERIIIKGRIQDRDKLNEEFDNSIACVSLKQAGLAVLDSFSNGVPFITERDSITGGERLNIKHGETGFLLDEEFNLEDFFALLVNDPEYVRKLGKKAFEYYVSDLNPSNMVGSLKRAILAASKSSGYIESNR